MYDLIRFILLWNANPRFHSIDVKFFILEENLNLMSGVV